MWIDEFRSRLPEIVRWAITAVALDLAPPESLPVVEAEVSDDSTGIGLTPQQQEWADKAVRKYAAVQRKKWHNWSEAMFEKK